MKKLITLVFISSLTACGSESNSDGSSKSTYTSCSITSSEALLASDRAEDVSQCWDGVDFKEKSLALDWCAKQVNSYIGKYIFGPTIEYQVSSTNCPPNSFTLPPALPTTPTPTPTTGAVIEDANPGTTPDAVPELVSPPINPAPNPPSGSVPNKYTSNITAVVANTKKSGSAWDAFGGAPDIKAELFISNNLYSFTKTQDSFGYNKYLEGITLNHNDIVTMKIWDLDISSHDIIATFVFNYDENQSSYSFDSETVSGRINFIIE